MNIFIADFTTAYGHLKLCDYLSRLGQRVLYHDTDILVYVRKPGEYQLPLGDRLGKLKDELEGDSIVDFVSSGPRSYGYKTEKDKVVLKAKGITQNYENCEDVCFDSLRDLVDAYIQNPNSDTPLEIRTPQQTEIKMVFSVEF